jgi:hypothetical protein
MKTKSFTKLSAAQKRVAIAKDVLKQIKAQKMLIESNAYWNVEADNLEFDTQVDKAILCKRDTKCTCCAAGAAVLSGIRLFNKVTIAAENGGYSERVKSEYFSQAQMGLIEAAFEESSGAHLSGNRNSQKYKKACRFNDGIDNDETRAIRIFKNIIKNNGEFKP